MNPTHTGKTRILAFEADYETDLRPLVETILDTFKRPWSGANVLVKPNILAGHPPEKAVTTHPTVVAAVVAALKDRGAKVLVGDNPGVGGYGKARRSAEVCGLAEVAGECFTNLGTEPVRHPIASRFFDAVTLSRQVLDADVVVNLPKLKTHSLTFLTGSIKNTFGYVVGADKMRVHAAAPTPRQFAEALVDIFSVRPPELTIMDAIVGMEGQGPSNGTPVRLGRLLASDNAVALDTAALHFVGKKARQVPHVNLAGQRGLGPTDMDALVVEGPLDPVKGFKFPNTFLPGVTGVVLNRFLSRYIQSAPEIIDEKCARCGLCAAHCPVGAMTMSKQGPRVDLDKCIHCYCCQEMCPEDAIRLSGRLIGFLRHTILRREQD